MTQEIHLYQQVDQQGKLIPDLFYIYKVVGVLSGTKPDGSPVALGDPVTSDEIKQMISMSCFSVSVECPEGWKPAAPAPSTKPAMEETP